MQELLFKYDLLSLRLARFVISFVSDCVLLMQSYLFRTRRFFRSIAYKDTTESVKARVISDIHLELRKDIRDLSFRLCSLQTATPCKYLFMAGDIVSSGKIREQDPELDEFFRKLSTQYEQIFYVFGNHEFYKTEEPTIVSASLELKRYFIRWYPTITILDDSGALLPEGHMVIGSTLWTNISTNAYCSMNDKNYVDKEDITKTHENSRHYLAAQLARFEKNHPVIVMTHHLPSFEFIDPKYKNRIYGSVNSGFASHSDDLFTFKGKWIFGHTHTPIRHKIKEIDFICNPLGYPKENKQFETCFEQYDCVFDIDP